MEGLAGAKASAVSGLRRGVEPTVVRKLFLWQIWGGPSVSGTQPLSAVLSRSQSQVCL